MAPARCTCKSEGSPIDDHAEECGLRRDLRARAAAKRKAKKLAGGTDPKPTAAEPRRKAKKKKWGFGQ